MSEIHSQEVLFGMISAILKSFQQKNYWAVCIETIPQLIQRLKEDAGKSDKQMDLKASDIEKS